MEKFKDKSYSPAERASDLLGRMTVEEKINQLSCYLLTNPDSDEIDVHVGAIAAMNAGSCSEQIAGNIHKIQEKVIQNSRFGIPALFHTEALAGPIQQGCAGFPLSISNAAAFNDENVRKMAEISRNQLKGMGIRHALSPVLDIARDFRYGRIGETYGSDPTLVSKLGCAFVEGMQGKVISEGVAATAKHFLGCAQPEAGVNQTRAVVDERELEEEIVKPFEAAIHNCDMKAVMNSYGEINGEPFCASEYYLQELLRNKLGFEGVTTSDYHSLDRLIQPFKLAETEKEAAVMALKGGMDMELPSKMLFPTLKSAVSEGMVDEETLDAAVYRVLKLKFELGLFEQPYPEFQKELYDNSRYEDFIKEATAQTVTLLKNTGILPVTDTQLKVGVIGQAGDSLRHMYGAYTAPATLEMLMNLAADENAVGMAGVRLDAVDKNSCKATPENINQSIKMQNPKTETIRSALEKYFPNIKYAVGFPAGAGEMVKQEELKAAESDLIIVCVGGKNGVGTSCTSGEGIDTTKIELPGEQEEIVKKLYRINSNMIIVHMDARPLVSRFIYEYVPGIIEAWLPCTYGGNAIADVITGKYNPSGHLPVDIPKSTGQTPYYYSQRKGSSMQSIRECTGDFIVNKDGYIDEKREAERPFGYGLSYTDFAYRNMMLEVNGNQDYIIRVEIENTGNREGADVVQLYGIDEYATIIRPTKELLGYCRIHLRAKEKAEIMFRGNLSQFAFADRKGSFRIEKGTFRFEVAKDSMSPVLTHTYYQPETVVVKRSERSFYVESEIFQDVE